MCYNYDRENVRGGINMLNYRKIEPADDKALAELIRANLEYYHLDIAGTVYFDPELDHMSGFYNADPQKRVYFTALDEAGNVIGGAGVAEFSGIADCAELQKLYLSSTVRGRGLRQRAAAAGGELGAVGGVQKPVSRNAHKSSGGDKAVRAGGFSADREADVGSTRREWTGFI